MIDVGVVFLAAGLAGGSLAIWRTRKKASSFLIWGILSTIFLLALGLVTLDDLKFAEHETVVVYANNTVQTTTTPITTSAYKGLVPLMSMLGAIMTMILTVYLYFKMLPKEIEEKPDFLT